MAENLKAQLEVSADTSGVVTGVNAAKKSISSLGTTATAVGAEASEGLDNIGKGGDRAAQRMNRATQSLIGSIQRTTAALEAGGRGSAKYFETLGNQKGVDPAALKPYLDALTAAESTQARVTQTTGAATAAAAKATNAYAAFGASQKLTAFQSQQLSYQLHDLFVQIQGGQSPITALVQQGSQISGTFGGVGNTFRALAGAAGPVALTITALVAAIAGVAGVLEKGASQSREFQNAITLTGNAAGLTEARFNSLVKTVSAATSATIGSSREVVQALVASGQFSGSTLAAASTAAQNFARATGESSEKVVQQFVSMAGNVAKSADELNSRYHFLTAAQLQYVKTLEDQGRAQEALALVFNALNGRVSAAAQNLGTLERAWLAIKTAASSAMDAMLSAGRAQTTDGAIANLEAQIDALDKRRSLNPTQAAARRAVLVEQLEAARETAKLAERSAASSAASVQRESAKTAFLKLQETMLTKQEQKARDIAKANELADRSGASPAERKRLLADIEKKYEDKGGISQARELAQARLKLQVEDAKAAGAALVDAYNNSERILEARKQAGLVADEQYYAAKRGFIELTTQAQVAALNKEIELLQSQQLKGKDALDRDREVLKAKEQIAKLEANRVGAAEVLAIQEEAAYRKVQLAIEDARAAAQDFLDTLKRRHDRDLAGLGQGNRQRERDGQRNETDDRFLQQRQSLARDLRRNQITKEQYDRELQIINQAHQDALLLDEDYFRRRDQLQQDFGLGAREALINYYDETRNVFAQAEQAVTSAFKGMEDALVQFVTTGKLDFKSLASSIIADLVRISVRSQITGPLAAAMGLGGGDGGGFLGGLMSIFGGRAIGGPVSAGGLYRVNENGPEVLSVAGKQYLMMGNQGGEVSPGGVGGTQTVVINQTVGDVASLSTLKKAMALVKADIMRTLGRSANMGGEFSA